MQILMVCLGNICRSPLAQGILEHKAAAAGLAVYVDSAGVGGWHAGESPDHRGCAVALKYGVDISHQRARQITAQDIVTFDRIYAMDRQNLKDILHLCPDDSARKRVRLIMDEVYPGESREVPDPYYDHHLFEPVYLQLSEAAEQIVKDILKSKSDVG